MTLSLTHTANLGAASAPSSVPDAVVAGLVAGYAVAIPVGALAVLLISLTARTSLRVGAAGALGVATADGAYATVAVVGGAAVAQAVEPIAVPLRWTASAVLVLMAARSARAAVRGLRQARADRLRQPKRAARLQLQTAPPDGGPAERDAGRARERPDCQGPGCHEPGTAAPVLRGDPALGTPSRAYLGLLGLTLLNPWAIIYFSALTLGNQHLGGTDGPGRAAFVAGIVFASVTWQLLLATGGAALGRALTGPRGRAVTGLASSAVIAALAVALAAGIGT
ncbi:LysE family transporter [Streptomyces oryzae]|uniref:LysE family transporter n=1 Tax=Streptomyces oryzae TaxID=1434886 RepID=A0ABS3XA10_9ACTN|nr:LysE family transporter [Streptomyces oryzae]MBO8192225.1 LysE family transporter [Streptomyces oryzae]